MSDEGTAAVPPERERETGPENTVDDSVVGDDAETELGAADVSDADTGYDAERDAEVVHEADDPDDAATSDELTGLDGLEELLRTRMTHAVSGLEPAAGTLDYLRRAVPVRRRRRQTALATTAVTVFAVSAGVTLAVRVAPSHTGGDGAVAGMANDSRALNSSAPNGGTGRGQSPAPRATTPTPVPAYSSATMTETVPSRAAAGATSAPAFQTPPIVSGTTVTVEPCKTSDLTASVRPGPVAADGTAYEIATVVNASASCFVTGPPTLSVLTAAGAPASGGLFQAGTGTAAPGLAQPGTWGKTLVLKPGDKFAFQFAWVPTQCVLPSQPPTTTTTTTAPPTTTTSPPVTTLPPSPGATTTPPAAHPPTTTPPTRPPTSNPTTPPPTTPAPVGYSVVYSLNGITAATANFSASCGASVYMTDIFMAGQYPDPRAGDTTAAPNPAASS